MRVLWYRIDHDQQVTVVRLTGELLLRDVPTVRAVLLKALAEHPLALIVDLAELVVQQTALLTIFPAVHRRAAEWPGAPLILAGATGAMATALRRMAMNTEIPVHPTVSDAIAAAQWPPRTGRRRLELRPTMAASAQARAFVEEACADWGLGHVRDAAALIVTELSDNAAIHARTDFTVTIAARARYLHVSVEDLDSQPARLREAGRPGEPLEVGGRGLRLVSEFSSGWGTFPTFTGKTTWATIRTV